MSLFVKECIVQEDPDSTESLADTSIECEGITQDEERSVTSEGDAEKASNHLVQRGVIYGLLLIFVVIALNDYRIRTAWENDCQVLSDSLIHSKGLPQENSDANLVEMMISRKGVDSWLVDRGYTFADDRSGFKLRVYAKNSGLRQFWIVVDYHVGGTKESPVMTTINFTPESYYFWDIAAPPAANSEPAQQKAAPIAGQRDNTSMQGGTPMGMGGNSGQGGRGNRTQNGSFDPEERFAEMDANDDEVLTEDEFSKILKENLKRFDLDDDGQVSKKEFMDAIEKAAQQRRAEGSRGGRGSASEGGPGVSGSGGGLYDVPDDPGEASEEVDPNRLPSE